MKKPPERTRTCPECKRRFSPQGLKGHLRIAHGINPDEENPDREVKVEHGDEPEEEPEQEPRRSSSRPRGGGSLLDGDGGLLS